MKQTREQIKEAFERDTKNHTMEVLKDDGVYRHLKFTNNGSQCYRFDLVTWPGHLAVSGDMGDYMFNRLYDMFEFFIMDDNDFNKKHVINPGYWAEKVVAANKNGEGIEAFSMDMFKQNVMNEYNNFIEQFQTDEDVFDDEGDDAEIAEAYPQDTQTLREMAAELLEALEDEVLNCDENGVRAYDAASDFTWKSDDGELKFDMQDFWDYSNTDYTYHYIWILYAIVHGIGEYRKLTPKEEAA